jgi:hypothetical protein
MSFYESIYGSFNSLINYLIRILKYVYCITYLISAIFVPALPMIQPISSFGTVISCVCVCAPAVGRFWLLVRSWLPANAASAKKKKKKKKKKML